jgi:uncharacterized protein
MSQPWAIDADGHVTEWHIDWAERFPADLRARAPYRTEDEHGRPNLIVDGYRFPNPMIEGKGRWASLRITHPAARKGSSDPHARLVDMDAEGIDIAVIYGTRVMFHCNATDDARYAQALCRAWNDWAGEYCAASPERLKFVALVPLGDMGAAVEEAQHAVRDLGAVGINVAPTHLGRSLDQTYFDPLYAAVQALDVPLCVHAHLGAGRWVETFGRHDNWLVTHALAFPLGLIHGLSSVVCGGVLDRFPTLRVAFLEGGCGWLPYFMDRLDEHVEKLPSLVPWLTQPPSAYIRGGRVYISCEVEENLAYPLSRLGEDMILYASDYPHWDGTFPHSVTHIAERTELTDTQKQKILRDNVARCYGLRVPAAAR